MRWFIALAALSLIGCKDATTDGIDADGDGILAADDCDDTNSAVNPDALERCNGIDDNCDGVIDEGVTVTFYADVDADTFGDPNAPIEACALPDGAVTNTSDCDDTDFDVNPDVIELCDDIDHNCDGDPLADAIGGVFFWRDADGDGFGTPQDTSRACEAPGSDWVAGGDITDLSIIDCDDTDGLTNPGADELCGTAARNVDENCNGVFDDNPVDGTEFPVDQDSDGFGSAILTASVCNAGDLVDLDGDGIVETATTTDTSDCDDTLSSIRPGVPESCDGIDNDCDPSTDEDLVATDTRQWWFDSDMDGSGDPANEVLACEMPAGYASAQNGEDCDDNDDTRSPSQLEFCDGLDNDCDSVADNGAIDAIDYYLDDDGDGLGDPAIGVVAACTAPLDRVEDNTDCDDGDPLVLGPLDQYLDSDLDGYGDALVAIAECDPVAGYVFNSDDCDDTDLDISPDTLWYNDPDGDGYGVSLADDPTLGQEVMSCLQPAGFSRESGDCDEGDTSFNPGAVDAPADGLDQDCDGFADDDALTDHCGDIAVNEVWGNEFIHTVSCNVTVDGTSLPHLVIQEGAIVRFVNGASIRVGTTFGGSMEANRVVFEHENRVQPERWNGLFFGDQLNAATPTVLRDSIIRDASGYGVRINNSEVTLDNVHISDTVGAAVSLQNNAVLNLIASKLEDNTGPGVEALDGNARLGEFTNNTITGNTVPLIISAASLERLRADVDPPVPLDPPVEIGEPVDVVDPRTNVLIGNDDDVVTLLDGTIREDTVWTDDLAVDYLVDGTVFVGDGSAPILTIEDGLEVEFTAGSGLRVGTAGAAGSLVVAGTSGGPDDYGVVFDSVDQTPGTWEGIQLGQDANDSSITGLDVRNAGANQAAGVVVAGDVSADEADRIEVEFVDSRVYGSSSTGLTADAAKLIISNSVFDDNGEHGFELLSNLVVDNTTVSNSTSTNNADSGARVYPSLAHRLNGGNSYANNDLPLEITGGVVDSSVTWVDLDEPYYVSGAVTVQNVNGPILTIAESVELYFGDTGEILVAPNVQGSLQVNGGVTTPVVMTALAEYEGQTPVNGAWFGLTIGRLDRGSNLNNLEISYAGKDTNEGALTLFGRGENPIDLVGVTVENSGSHGLFADDFNGNPGPLFTITDSVFQNNDDIGINVVRGGLDDVGPALGLVGTRIEGNGLHAMALPPESGGFIELNDPTDSTTNSFTNNNLVLDPSGNDDFIELNGGNITIDTRYLNHGIPYRLTNASMRVRQGSILTIDAGVTMEVESDNALEIIIGRNDLPGGLVAIGTPTEPIRFVSAAPVPTRGDWVGISLGEECITTSDLTATPPIKNRCVLDYVEIAHAGDTTLGVDRGALDVYVRSFSVQPDPALVTHTVIRESLSFGLVYYWDAGQFQPPFNDVDNPVTAQGIHPLLRFACEDLDGDQYCDVDGVDDANDVDTKAGYCWEAGVVGRHGTTNYFCDNTDNNALARTSQNPYTPGNCQMNGPVVCTGLPAWTDL